MKGKIMLSVQELRVKETELRSKIAESENELQDINRLLQIEATKRLTGREVRVEFYAKLQAVNGPLSVVVCNGGGKPFTVPTLAITNADAPF
jgi:hypothetical protein